MFKKRSLLPSQLSPIIEIIIVKPKLRKRVHGHWSKSLFVKIESFSKKKKFFFWWLDFGEKWLEFIPQSQIKGDYNFTIVVLGTAQG